ncbi:hypothetical protein [Acidovorax sp.]|uniref:hypothetical protein n=1 Tax=Acidovorax sp. TaxID=1872122 RepID=UPI00391F3879
MPRARTPKAKAEVSGAAQHDPQRFNSRKGPKRIRPVGEPYATMTDAEKLAWAEFQRELPWLTASHRILLRMACVLSARMESGEMGVEAMKALSSLLSKLGATPVDETKVNHGSDEEEDPADKFFGSH